MKEAAAGQMISIDSYAYSGVRQSASESGLEAPDWQLSGQAFDHHPGSTGTEVSILYTIADFIPKVILYLGRCFAKDDG